MKKSRILRVMLACAALVALAWRPQAAFAQRGGGGHGGGGGGGFHGGGFSGGGHASYGGAHYSYSGAHVSGGYRGSGYGASGYHGGGYYGHGGYGHHGGGYYGHGWYGGHGGYYGWGGRYWGYPGYGWGIGFGWPYWGWGYPYGYYGYGAWYAPSYTYTYPTSSDAPPQQNPEQNIDPNAYPFTCPPGYTCIQDGNGDAAPGNSPANAAPRPSSNANPQPWRAPAPAGNANVGDSTKSYYVPHGRVMSVDHIVAMPAIYRTAVPTNTIYGPMSPELKRAMQMLHEMPPFAREREITTGRYSHFTSEEKQLLRSVN